MQKMPIILFLKMMISRKKEKVAGTGAGAVALTVLIEYFKKICKERISLRKEIQEQEIEIIKQRTFGEEAKVKSPEKRLLRVVQKMKRMKKEI